jgi:hypothetical protein
MESLLDRHYQFCVVDPEGDYENFEEVLMVGGPDHAPTVDEAMRLLEKPEESAIVSLTGMGLGDRPPFFLALLARLLEMRSHTGRPHWFVLDEAHHLMPAAWEPPAGVLPEQIRSVVLVTVHPDLLSPTVLQRVDTVVAVGKDAATTLRAFASATGAELPDFTPPDLERGEVLLWRRGEAPVHLRARAARSQLRRHRRKYAAGALPPEWSFYFRGPEGKLTLRAQNLLIFLQLAEGIDEATWTHHLRRHDYSRWFREHIKDEALAAEAERIEGEKGLSPDESRAQIRAAIERDYTLPAEPVAPVADDEKVV